MTTTALQVRLNEEENQMLNDLTEAFCSRENRSETIRRLIRLAHKGYIPSEVVTLKWK